MAWTTSIDFTPPVNPGFGSPIQPIQRPHRPAQLSIGSYDTVPTTSLLAISRPDAPSSVENTAWSQSHSSVPDFGLTVTFTGPGTAVHRGIPFTWSVFIVNRSDRPRKLALQVLPKRKPTDARITRPPFTGYGGKRGDPGTVDAVVDENIIHAMQRNSTIEQLEIVCLSTEIRVGPLAPSACYEVQLKFLAPRVGVVSIGAFRVVDLGTLEHVDIKALPTIVVEPADTTSRPE